MNTISREDLHAHLDHVTLLEALPEAYYRQGHLPGARHFPVDKAKDLATALPKDAPIVVYCASETCKNSHQVAKLLEDLGHTDVRVYAGGKADWQAAGLPLELV